MVVLGEKSESQKILGPNILFHGKLFSSCLWTTNANLKLEKSGVHKS